MVVIFKHFWRENLLEVNTVGQTPACGGVCLSQGSPGLTSVPQGKTGVIILDWWELNSEVLFLISRKL